MSIDVLLSRLKGVRPRGPSRWVALCSAHKDRTPSLSIRLEGDGRILLHCFAGCETYDVLDALGLEVAELFPPRPHDDHAAPITQHLHTHAAADALRVLAREAGILMLAAQDMAAGAILSPKERARMLEAALRIRGAARMV